MTSDARTERLSVYGVIVLVISFLNVFKGRDGVRAPSRSPTPPGRLIENFILPRSGLSVADLSLKSGIEEPELSRIFNGEVSITPSVDAGLRAALGDSMADIVLKQQESYLYFGRNGEWPPSPRRR